MISRLNAALGLAIGAALIATAAAAAEPRLKPVIEVEGSQVTLGDLFDNAGAIAGKAVMPAPRPGERFKLTIPQVFELANAHGLGWRPVTSFEHVTVQRAWRYLDEGRVRNGLMGALRHAGGGDRLNLVLADEALRIKVARGALAEVRYDDVSYSADGGRFRATLVVTEAGDVARRYNLVGKAYESIEVPVLRSRLRTDDVIEERDIEWVEIRVDALPRDAIRDARDLIGKSLTRVVRPGKPLLPGDVGEPTIVQRGSVVAMHFISRHMHLVASGRAQESGAMGDVIRVQNVHSRLTIDAVITGTNRVEAHSAHMIAAQ